MVATKAGSKRQHARNIAAAVETLDAYKLDRGCADCGYNKCAFALHFDHIDPSTKTKELGWVDDRSKLKTVTKLANYIKHVETYCVVRCANCHAERTAREKHWFVRRSTIGE